MTDPSNASTGTASASTDGAAGQGRPLTLGLQDRNEILLLLRGHSVIDWHRLAMRDESEARRLLRLNCIDYDEPHDRARLADLRARAVRYINEVLNLRIDQKVATEVPWLELPLIASGRTSGRQRAACTLLKVMHIIYHLDAREQRTKLAISENEIYSRVEENVSIMFDELRTAGVPVVEFSWSRKTRNSLITKLLLKRETSAARVFDRLRFRLIVKRHEDLIPALNIMLQRCVPFNYVVPGHSLNSLLDLDDPRIRDTLRPYQSMSSVHDRAEATGNEFSGKDYRILNFVADLPVRLSSVAPGTERGSEVVFVLAEFQIMDRQTAENNESGDNSHLHYKQRQHQHVRERLLREPRMSGPHAGAGKGKSGK